MKHAARRPRNVATLLLAASVAKVNEAKPMPLNKRAPDCTRSFVPRHLTQRVLQVGAIRSSSDSRVAWRLHNAMPDGVVRAARGRVRRPAAARAEDAFKDEFEGCREAEDWLRQAMKAYVCIKQCY